MLYQLIMCVKGKIPNRVRSWVLESVSLTSDRTGLAWACVHGGRRPAGAPAYTMSSDPRGASPQPQQYKPICPPGRGGEEEPSQRCWTGPRTTLGTSWFMSGVWSDRTPENPLPKSSEAHLIAAARFSRDIQFPSGEKLSTCFFAPMDLHTKEESIT